MEKQDKDDLMKKSREKSALYPAVTILECLEFIKKIDSLGGKIVSYVSILSIMGLASPSTRSFLSRISASKQYGFIVTGGSTVQLTDLAKRIIYPSAIGEDQKLLKEAFGNPPLYAKLIERFQNKALPAKDQLANILMNDYRIIKQVKDNAADCFIESASYLGLLKNDILCMDEENYGASHEYNNRNEENPQNVNSNESVTPSKKVDSMSEDGYNFEIPTLGKKTARFYIPSGVTEKDLDYIKLYIENMLPIFLDNLKSEICVEQHK